MTKVETPLTITRTMARACPFIRQRSRQSFRLSALMASPVNFLRLFFHGIFGDLGDEAIADIDHAVRHFSDICIMGDDDRGGSQLMVNPMKGLKHNHTCCGIKRSSRFVAEKNFRILGYSTGDCNTLLLTA